jgi:heme A synthase
MSQHQSSLKRLAWIITLLGVAMFAGAFIYFAMVATPPDRFGNSRQQANQRHEFTIDATQSGLVELVGLAVAGIGIVLLVIAYATAQKGTETSQPTAESAAREDQA